MLLVVIAAATLRRFWFGGRVDWACRRNREVEMFWRRARFSSKVRWVLGWNVLARRSWRLGAEVKGRLGGILSLDLELELELELELGLKSWSSYWVVKWTSLVPAESLTKKKRRRKIAENDGRREMSSLWGGGGVAIFDF